MHNRHILWQYLLVPSAVALATLLGHALTPWLNLTSPYLIIYPLVMVMAVVLGTGPALLAAAMGAILAEVFFVAPVGTMHASFGAMTRMVVLISSGLFVGWLCQRLRQARALAQQQAAAARLAEEGLRRGEQRLQLALEAAQATIWEYDLASDEVVLDPGARRRVGLPDGVQVVRLKETLLSLFDPQDRRRIEQAVQALLDSRSDGRYQAEHHLTYPDGTRAWFYVQGQVVYEGEGLSRRAVRVIGVSTNVTERKTAEEALRESEQRLRCHAENSPLAVIEWDPLLRIKRWNAGAERMLGWRAEEVLGKRLDDLQLVHKKCRHVGQMVQKMLEGGLPNQFSADCYCRKDGAVIHCEWHNSVVADAAGRPTSILSLGQDITERKRAEEQLKALNETLERRVAERTAEAEHRAEQLRILAAELTQAEQRERRRLAQVLHDHVQQLLVSMKFSTSTLRRQPEPAKAQDTIRQLDRLLDESITASRSLTVELSPPILYEAGLAAALQWLAGWMHDKHGLVVEVAADDIHVQCEAMRSLLYQSVRELLLNVVKHARIDRADVRMYHCPEGNLLCLEIRDKGIGFQPAGRRQAGQGGAGLGLFGLQERLQMLGGQMQIDSGPGQGTRVQLQVPLVKDLGPPAGTHPPPRLPTGAAEGLAAKGQIRILLADDHHLVRSGLAGLLHLYPDLEVVGEAADGQAAVDAARQLRPDVILMDVTMPKMNGIEATRRIMQEMPATRIVGLSMHSEQDMAARIRDAGAVAYVTKSGPPEELVAAVRAAVACATPST